MSERKTLGDAEKLCQVARSIEMIPHVDADWQEETADDLRRIAARLTYLETGEWKCACGRNHTVDRCTNCHGEWPDGRLK